MPGNEKVIRIETLDEFDRELSRDGGEALAVPGGIGRGVRPLPRGRGERGRDPGRLGGTARIGGGRPMKHDEYHRQFADAIIEQIRQGTAPWQKPWGPGERVLPANVDTGRAYAGGNSIHVKGAASGAGPGRHGGQTCSATIRMSGGGRDASSEGTVVSSWRWGRRGIGQPTTGFPGGWRQGGVCPVASIPDRSLGPRMMERGHGLRVCTTSIYPYPWGDFHHDTVSTGFLRVSGGGPTGDHRPI